jgi:glutamine amidotransferase
MCRHLAYFGAPVTLADLVLDPHHSLLHQSYAPKHQRSGAVNADGFGVGWWNFDERPEPARYRRAQPIWTDRSFASFASTVRTTAMVAAVRSATPPLPVEESGAAPFTNGPWLFSHNGAVEEMTRLRPRISATRQSVVEGASDSELLFALVLDRLDDDLTAGDALAAVVAEIDADFEARLNFLLSDGRTIAATAWGNSLFTRASEGGLTIASEPLDDDRGWTAVPDRSLVLVEGGRSTTTSIEGAP